MTVGRHVLVVGASSGIGLAAALEFARRGDRVVLVSRDEVALMRAENACREAGPGPFRHIVADVNDQDAVTDAVQRAVQANGPLDAIVHTATVMAYGRLEDLPAEVFRTVVDTAVHGTMNLARAVVPVLREQGRGTFVVVNSLLGSVTVPTMGAYATSKWGQRAVIRTLQQELRDAGDVHVCMVSPGSINTPVYYQAANYVGREARPPVPVLQPERAAAVIARLVDRPRKHVSVPVGPGNPVIIMGYRFLPFVFDAIVGPMFRLLALTRARRSADTGNVLAPSSDGEQATGRWPRREPGRR